MTKAKNKMSTLCKIIILLSLVLSVAAKIAAIEPVQPTKEHKIDDAQPDKLTCTFNLVTFSANYETARLSTCKQRGPNHYLISTHPENTPINPSPWYGFSVQSTSKTDQTITIEIEAQNSRPRYLPKLSLDKNQWEDMAYTVENNNLLISVDIGKNEPIKYISGQEIIDNAMYDNWNQKIASTSPFTLETIGKSTQGRAINALIHTQADNTEWLYIIGRQHPPEITGAIAMLSFVETLIEKNKANQQLFERFNIFIVPNVNPDGVAAGNWRHNVNGLDLNRDWGKFTQTETRVVHEKLLDLMQDHHQLVFALDFHSTQQDIFYTMPGDYIPIKHKGMGIEKGIEKGIAPSLFVEEWLNDVKQNTVRSFTLRERPGSSPGRGVFKQFIADEYGVHAVTYEMGDNTQRELIRHVANQSAITLVDKLLATPAEQFTVN
jgi:hypothetical protein